MTPAPQTKAFWALVDGVLVVNLDSRPERWQAVQAATSGVIPAAKLHRLPATLELAITALLLAVLIGIPLGLYCGLRPKAFSSRVIMAGSILGFSLPAFWVGLFLIMVFAIRRLLRRKSKSTPSRASR